MGRRSSPRGPGGVPGAARAARARTTTAGSARSSGCSGSPTSRRARRSGCPPGTEVFNALVALSREMGRERGYVEVKTPQIYDSSLWETSGHWEKYGENMFVTEYEDRQMALKPMNCPGHCQLYSLATPLLPRPPDALSGSRGCCTAASRAARCTGCCGCATSPRTTRHIFCTEDQIQDEVAGVLEFAFATYKIFGDRRPARALDAARGADRLRRAVGPERGGAAQRAREPRPRVRPQRGRRRLLRPEDRHAHDRLARPLVAARDLSARLQHAGSASGSPTPAPTTPSTGR